MIVSELYALTNWIDREIREKQVLEKYQVLHAALTRNSQPNQPQTSFEVEKDDLIEAINSLALNILTNEQHEFLGSLGIDDHVGSEGVKTLEDILFKNSLDVATAVQKLAVIIASISTGLGKAAQIQGGLDGSVNDLESESEFDQVLIRVHFSGKASIDNIVKFKKWGSIWFDIGRGIALATGTSPDDIKVVGANKGSIIVDLAVVYGVAKVASFIVLKSLEITERVMAIRLQAENIRHLKLKNTQIATDLESELQQEKEEALELAKQEIISELALNKGNQGDAITALTKSIEKLVDFVEKGGEVDFVMPEEGVDGEETIDEKDLAMVKALRDNIQNVHRIEHQIRALEDKSNE